MATNPYVKLAASHVLRFVPGPFGAAFETRLHFARRQLDRGTAIAAFETALAMLAPDGVCIDLGANVGTVTERLVERAGHVHAFEPDPWSFGELSRRVGERPNVTLHNVAIGTHDGTMRMLRDPGFAGDPSVRSHGTSAFPSVLWQQGEAETFEVPVVDIRRVLRGLGRPVAIMKVDIEGAEVDLIETLLDAPERNLVEALFVETHEVQIPELRRPTAALKKRVRSVTRPVIHLGWH